MTSTPSSALSVVSEIGGNGGWSTAVARWHMRYSMRRTSLRRHDRASKPCTHALALRAAQCLSVLVNVTSCIVWYAVRVITYIERSCAYISNDTPSLSHLTMPILIPLFFLFFLPGAAFVVRHRRHLVHRFNHPRTRAIVGGLVADATDLAHALAVDQATR